MPESSRSRSPRCLTVTGALLPEDEQRQVLGIGEPEGFEQRAVALGQHSVCDVDGEAEKVVQLPVLGELLIHAH